MPCYVMLHVMFLKFNLHNIPDICHADFQDQPRTWFKGADTTVVIKFLVHILEEKRIGPESDELLQCLLKCCKAANKFFSLLYHQELWLPPRVAKLVTKAGKEYITSFKQLANLAYGRGLTRFLLTPKMHLLMHSLLWLGMQAAGNGAIMNPLVDSCQMCEDFINKIATLGRSSSPRKFATGTLKKYLIAAQRYW